ncbi:DUF5667 domain-containing protein [Streptomyces glaucosporus]|uniref:DUF5667 domain-containing protein n=2 Tax=Streptomyces glaucosporus TaxID=284044 RepID=A0ABN3IXH8_9ACTN
MGAVSPSRRANAFAQALDEREPEGAATDRSGGAVPATPDTPAGPADPDGTAGRADEQATLLSLADRLASLPRPAMAPDVKAAQRARLIAAMESAFAEGGDSSRVPGQRTSSRPGRGGAHRASPLGPLGRLRPRSRLTQGLAAGGLGVSVAAGAFAGAAVASTDALPGDTLYGLKLGMEDLTLDLADDDADRGKVHLDHASKRLNEARRLLERDRSGRLDHESVGEIRRVLSLMRHDAAEGHRLLSGVYERDGSINPIRTLSSFSESHGAVWQQLRGRLPEQLTDVSDQVTSVFDAINDEVTPLRSLLRPESDDEPADGDRTGDGRAGGDGTARPAPSAPDEGSPEDHRRDGGRPSPSGSRTDEEEEGLPDPGDLLDPPADGDDMPSVPGGDVPGVPKPDITIPPLLPNILPGLGIDSDDDHRGDR